MFGLIPLSQYILLYSFLIVCRIIIYKRKEKIEGLFLLFFPFFYKYGIERPRHHYIDQIKAEVAVVRNNEVNEMVLDRSWIKLHRQEHNS